jgi:DNA invertase Pin-like site-specific DNA recombinase
MLTVANPKAISARRQWKVATYSRASLSEASDSLTTQEQQCQRYVDEKLTRHGEVAHARRYVDCADGLTLNRTGLIGLCRDVYVGEINCIVTFKLNRISQDCENLVNLLNYFEHHKARIISVRECFDTSLPAGRAVLSVFNAFANCYSQFKSLEDIESKLATQTLGV